MKIIIVGCGQVGRTLAKELIREGNDITVIDTSAEKIKAVTNSIDVMGIVGNGASHLTQAEANVKNADLLIAVTNSDELNLLCCIIAKKEGDCHTIARVRDHAYNKEANYLKDELGLAMVINPELEAAEDIARVLRFPAALAIEPFAKGRVELIKFKLPEDSELVGTSVKDAIAKYKYDVLFCSAERGDEVFVTKGDFVFKAKDVISMIAPPRRAAAFLGKIGLKGVAVGSAIVVGGGEVTHYLCDICSKRGIKLKVIDNDRGVCEKLARDFSDVTVIHGDTAEQETLIEEGIEHTDAFLALTDNDEENIFLSLFAKERCEGKLVTKIDRLDFNDVIQHLELDTVVYPKNVTSSLILRFVRSLKGKAGSNMEALYPVVPGKVEAYEFLINDKTPIVGKRLCELKLKDGVLIAAILRGRSVITPHGLDTVEAGDRVIIVSLVLGITGLDELLKK
ncbi:MAG: Trk system potassium transporter TrkA [Clostridia bacterium]|nr:Trk system potassium transporter TrkA [Clostridia bacterium]